VWATIVWDFAPSLHHSDNKNLPLWSSGQSSWLQRSGFDSQRYQISWEVGLDRGPLSLVSTIEELLGRKSSGFGLETREYGRREPLYWPRNTLYPQNVSINFDEQRRFLGRYIRSRTQATELLLLLLLFLQFEYIDTVISSLRFTYIHTKMKTVWEN
jgi:hypothetical protein